MSGPVTKVSVNRRTVLKRLAAGTALASGGCSLLDEPEQQTRSAPMTEQERDPGSQPTEPREVTTPTSALTRRLFAINEHMTALTQEQLTSRMELKSRIQSSMQSSGGVASPIQSSINVQESRFIAWIDPETAAELGKFPGVSRVERVKPGEPTDSTISPLRGRITKPPQKGRRQFFVVLGPNSWPTSIDAKGFHSKEDIARLWAQRWKTQADVEVEVVKAEKWSVINSAGVHIGATPGQIRVSIPGEKVPADVLKSIQSHPQVLRLQWDHADVIYNCGPCGMG
jgi:hypothetical protein